MATQTFKRSAAAGAAFGLGGASLFGASAAAAADFECELPDATVIVDGICELVITEDGEYTFPGTLGKVSAIVVGAGGGGWGNGYTWSMAYGGGGGEVVYVDEVALDTEIAVEIGEGGAAGGVEDTVFSTPNAPGGDGGDTVFGSVTAAGGIGGDGYDHYGTSGSGNEGDYEFEEHEELDWEFLLAGGGGAAGDADGADGGPGYLPSELPDADPELFPASADSAEYGVGGSGARGTDAPAAAANSGSGGSAATDIVDPEGSFFDLENFAYDSADGADGVVIVRFAATEVAEEEEAQEEEDEELAPTGVDAAGALAAGAVAAAAGAALTAVVGSRRRRTAN